MKIFDIAFIVAALFPFTGCELNGPSHAAIFSGSVLIDSVRGYGNTNVFAVEEGYQVLSFLGFELHLSTVGFDGTVRERRTTNALLPMDPSARIIRVQDGRYLIAGRSAGDPVDLDTVATLMAALVDRQGNVVWMKSYPLYKGPHIDGAFDLQQGEAAVVMNSSPSPGIMVQDVAVISLSSGEMVRHIDHSPDCITGLAVLSTGALQWISFRSVQPWVFDYSVRTGDRNFTVKRSLPVTTTGTGVSVLTSTVHRDSTVLVMTESFAGGKDSLSIAVVRPDGSERFRRRISGWSNCDLAWLDGIAAIANDRIWVMLNPLFLNSPTIVRLDRDGMSVTTTQFRDHERLIIVFPDDPFGPVAFGVKYDPFPLTMMRIP